MADLGEAKGTIRIDGDFSGLKDGEAAISQFNKKVEDGTASLENRYGPALSQTATYATATGAAILAGFAVAANSAASFEERLSAIQAVSGATADEMNLISEAALRIGADTSFSAGEAALAMEELIKAGLSTEDVLNGAADATVALAAAGEVELPEAATIAANAMNQFNLSAEDMVRVSDLIAGAANASAIDVSQFGYSLSQVGAVANLVGLSFDDTATAIALMGNAGIVGSDAGTSLKAMLMRLNPSTREAATLMEELGIITADGANQFYTAEGEMRSMAEIADVLGGALNGMTAEQKQAALTTLFGADAIRGAAIIAEGGSEAFREMGAAMTEVTAAEVAATRLDNFRGSVEELMGSLETLAIRIGQTLLPRMREMVERMTGFVNSIGTVSPGVLALATTIGVAAGGMLVAVGAAAAMANAFLSIRAAILTATAAQGLFVAATNGVTVAQRIATASTALWNAVLNMNPILRIISLVLALGAAIITLSGGWGNMIPLFQAIMNSIMSSFEPLIPVVQELAATLASSFGAALQALIPALTSIAMALLPVLVNVLTMVAPLVAAVAQVLTAVLVPVLGLIGPLFGVLVPIIEALSAVLVPLVNLLATVLTPVLDVIAYGLQLLADGLFWVAEQVTAFFASSNGEVSQAQTVWDGFVSWLTEVWNGIVLFFQETATNISNFFTTMGTGITTAWNAVVMFFQTVGMLIAAPFIWLWEQITIIWAGIMAVVTPVVTWFQTWVVPLIQAAINLIVAIVQFLFAVWLDTWTQIFSVVSSIVSNISNFVSSVFSAIFGFLSGIWNSIYSVISSAVQRVWSFISSVWGAIVGVVSTIFNNVRNTVQTVFNAIWNVIQTIVNNVRNFIQSTWNAIVGIVTTIFNNVKNAIERPLNDALNFIGGLKDRIMGFFSNAGAWLVDAGRNIIQGLINGIQAMIGGLTSMLGGITNLIPKNKGPEDVDKKLLTPNGQMIMQSLIEGLASQVPMLRSMLGGLTAGIPDMLASADVRQSLAVMPRDGEESGATKVLNYYAAEGSSIDSEEDLFEAMKTGKVVAGW